MNAAEKLRGEKRIVAEVPSDVYRRLKLRSLDRGISMRACLIELINEGTHEGNV